MIEGKDRIANTIVKKAPSVLNNIHKKRNLTDSKNPSNEQDYEADKHANKILVESLKNNDIVGQIVSEELDEAINLDGNLSVAIDPLDGSSNIPSNNIVGTIFGVYEEELPCPGKSLDSAGYILYGPVTELIYTEGDSVKRYIVEENGDLNLVNEDVRLPENPKYYGIGGTPNWNEEIQEMSNSLSKKLKLRYGGSLVGDFTKILLDGGIFCYPKRTDMSNGKYRAYYEALPMAYLMRCAGGLTTDGEDKLLSKEFDSIHSRTPFFSGNSSLVRKNTENLGS